MVRLKNRAQPNVDLLADEAILYETSGRLTWIGLGIWVAFLIPWPLLALAFGPWPSAILAVVEILLLILIWAFSGGWLLVTNQRVIFTARDPNIRPRQRILERASIKDVRIVWNGLFLKWTMGEQLVIYLADGSSPVSLPYLRHAKEAKDDMLGTPPASLASASGELL